ncbi:MAG: hypothetical protein N2651_06990, partial [Fimbriimonadales bacterium]|nr:hypothetical protein [Fimbriimonadales bacterium]
MCIRDRWCDIAQAYRAAWQARQGDHEGARKTLAQLPHDFVQSFHFHRKRAVAELAQSGMLDEAAQLVTQALLPVGEDPEVVQSILNAYKQAGRWDDAFVWARRLPSEWREYALGEWAAHALQQGDPDPTRRLNPSERTPAVLMRLARAAQTLNRPQQARSWREDTLRQLKRFPEPWREFQHMLVAIELAQVGDFEQAETVIRQMKRGQPPCFWAARQAANSALEQGDLNYAQRFAALIGAQNLRVRAYAAIAARLYQRGQQQQAQAIIERLKRELQPLKRLAPDASADLADGVCLPIIEAGSYELAQPLLRELEAEMQQIPFNSNRALLMYCIVKCYVRAGRLENAFRIAAEADTPEEQTRALLAILHAQIWGYQN